MGEPENVEIIRQLYSEFLSLPERVTSPELLAYFDPGVVIQQSTSLIGTEGTFHGYAGLERVSRESFAAFSDLHWVPKRFEAEGDQVVATVDSRASGKASGVEVSTLTTHTWTLREGRIVRWHVRLEHADPDAS